MAVTRKTLRLSDQLRIFVSGIENQVVRQFVEAWARAWEVVNGEWEAAIADLVANSQGGKWPSRSQIGRASKAQRALELTHREILELTDFAGIRIVVAAREVTDQAAFWQARLIASQMPTSAGTEAELVARFFLQDDNAVRAIVERTKDQIESLKKPLADDAVEAMKQALIRGVVVGENPKRAAAQMLRKVEGRFDGGLTRALTIARTEILDAHRSGTAAAQFDQADVLDGWIWSANLDPRTCPSCWARHGTEHPLSEPGPHDHQQGRCARLPKVKSWADLGFDDLNEPEDLLPNSQTVFAALSPEEQLRVMGPVRLKALQSGSVAWTDLSVKRKNDGWRDSWVPAPVKETRRRMLRPVR